MNRKTEGLKEMLTIQDVNAEQFANLLCNYRQALSEECSGIKESRIDQSSNLPSQNERQLMVAAVRLALLELAAPSFREEARRKYFATPGEADWGC